MDNYTDPTPDPADLADARPLDDLRRLPTLAEADFQTADVDDALVDVAVFGELEFL